MIRRLIQGRKGFTLIELLIVLAVLAILAAVVIPNVTGFLGRGKERAFNTDRQILQTAVDGWRTDIGQRAGNPWPILLGGTDTTCLVSPPAVTMTCNNYIDIAALATDNYIKGTDAVRSADILLNTTATNTTGSYGWFVGPNGVVNAYNTAAAAVGFQAGVYP